MLLQRPARRMPVHHARPAAQSVVDADHDPERAAGLHLPADQRADLSGSAVPQASAGMTEADFETVVGPVVRVYLGDRGGEGSYDAVMALLPRDLLDREDEAEAVVRRVVNAVCAQGHTQKL